MAVMLRHERDNIYRLEIRGRLRKQDFDDVQGSVASEIRRVGAIRLLVRLAQFEGWEQGANWRDLSFYITHGDSLERIAIVGDERWRSEALMFAAADLRRGAVAFFPAANASDAYVWLGEGAPDADRRH